MALGLKENVRTPLETSTGLIRTSNEDVKPYFFIYKSIYFDKILSEDESDIDKITDIDAAFELVEQYANTGFKVLAQMKKEFPDDELFSKKLLTKINDMYKQYEPKKFNVDKYYTE